MSSMPYLIEFVGLPGAGKTTIAQAFVDAMRKRGLKCYCRHDPAHAVPVARSSRQILSKLSTLCKMLGQGLRHRAIAAKALRYSTQMRPRKLENVTRAFKLLAILDSMESLLAQDYDVIVLDQGVIQGLWSIAVNGSMPDDGQLRQVLASILSELPLRLVHVDTSLDLVLERMSQRVTMNSRFDKLEPNEAAQALQKVDSFFDKVIELGPKFQQLPYLIINGEEPVERNVGHLEDFVRRWGTPEQKQGSMG